MNCPNLPSVIATMKTRLRPSEARNAVQSEEIGTEENAGEIVSEASTRKTIVIAICVASEESTKIATSVATTMSPSIARILSVAKDTTEAGLPITAKADTKTLIVIRNRQERIRIGTIMVFDQFPYLFVTNIQ